jgi:hypothetical protein
MIVNKNIRILISLVSAYLITIVIINFQYKKINLAKTSSQLKESISSLFTFNFSSSDSAALQNKPITKNESSFTMPTVSPDKNINPSNTLNQPLISAPVNISPTGEPTLKQH